MLTLKLSYPMINMLKISLAKNRYVWYRMVSYSLT